MRPVILLPLGAVAGLSPALLEALLAHELAHIVRRDYLLNLGLAVAFLACAAAPLLAAAEDGEAMAGGGGDPRAAWRGWRDSSEAGVCGRCHDGGRW